ncbi:DedA family protein [Enteractinococcus coprophilus]|uniref:Membrane protein DedA with SNARE-associated domain n=1 Tax=Enteractinococcus coprophilus TaxID=1027633 RepID=A0A543ANP7_9MICC|nr:VTT domain-containing protein [Enteractinococcus coprophilus]TQL74204.1 membrane protein DedA with SNARE-associated domain [Enteractinococcus coprophilus]
MGSGVWYNPMSWDGPWIWVWLGLYVIIFCRAGGTYLIGRAVRNGVTRIGAIQKILASSAYQRAETAIDRWGAPAVAVSFLTIGFQTAINLAAGAIRMRWYHYLPALLIGGALWATVYATIGSVSFGAIMGAYERSPVATIGLTIVLTLVLVGWIIWRLTATKASTEEKIRSTRD